MVDKESRVRTTLDVGGGRRKVQGYSIAYVKPL